MPEEPRQQANEEGDLFDRWLAHRDDEEAGAGGHLRSTTVPPKWAPKVVAPRPEAQLPADPAAEVMSVTETLVPEPILTAPEEYVGQESVTEPVVPADAVEPSVVELPAPELPAEGLVTIEEPAT